jgi:hypothetical protein
LNLYHLPKSLKFVFANLAALVFSFLLASRVNATLLAPASPRPIGLVKTAGHAQASISSDISPSGLSPFSIQVGLLVVVTQIMVPSLPWLARPERRLPVRLWLLAMVWIYGAVAYGILNDLAGSLAQIAGLHYDHNPVPWIALDMWFPFLVLARHAPSLGFKRLAQAYLYFSDLRAYTFIRPVEIRAAQLVGRAARPINLTELFHTPDAVLYRSVIAILDARKLLNARAATPASMLGAQLDSVADPDLTYQDAVTQLCRVGRKNTQAWLLGRLSGSGEVLCHSPINHCLQCSHCWRLASSK